MRSRRVILLLLASAGALGAGAGVLAVRQLEAVRLDDWQTMDLVRRAALEGFRAAELPTAERYVRAQLATLERCHELAPSYPCDGRVKTEALLMMAALRAEAGDDVGKRAWLARLSAQCGPGCTSEDVARALNRYALRRNLGGSVQPTTSAKSK